jgi:2-polyprenyl-3-methyl-5-hydroxy-6-metoxy-1,4-benzoquinol methylase
MTTIYFFLERAILLLHNASAAAIQGVGLGLMNHDRLERLTEHRYRSAVSPGSYAESGYLDSGLFLWERHAIQRHFPPGGRILVASAGAGREMIALANAGFRVNGFDCSAPLVQAGQKALRERNIEARLDYAAPSTVPPLQEHYDAVLVGFSGYMYIAGKERRIAFLKALCRLLEPGAPLMISFTEGSHGRRRDWTARIGTAIRRLRGADPVEEGDCLKDGFQHHFVQKQIRAEMNEAGLEPIYYSGGTSYGHAIGRVR